MPVASGQAAAQAALPGHQQRPLEGGADEGRFGGASLLIAPQWIGDAVMTEPLLRRLAARGERLTVLALPWVAPVYRAMPQVAEVLELPLGRGGVQWRARWRYAQTLRGRFAVAYVCPNSLKSALIPWWAGIARRVGYLGEQRWGVLNQRLPNPPCSARPAMVAWYSALSGQDGVQADRPQLHVPAAVVQPVLAAQGLAAQSYYVMAPGAEFGPAKRWPEAHFAQVARALGRPVLLLGSAKDAALCSRIAAAANAAAAANNAAAPKALCRNLAGRTSLDEALALIAGAVAMVSNDSGLMHVAAALGLRQVALFGSSSPLHTPPLNDGATVLWLKHDAAYQPPLDCAPCFARECRYGHTRCLRDIAPAKVLSYL